MSAPTTLREVLDERGSSALRLAEHLKVTRQIAATWVRGGEPVPRRRQAQISLWVEVPMEVLFDERGYARRKLNA